MKSLSNYILESQTNNTVKALFEEIDNKLVSQKWDEITPIIENIFKNRWGKTIKLDNSFRDKIERGQQMLLGYNIKTNKWIIVRYNRSSHGVRGAVYDGKRAYFIGDTPTYWDFIPRYIEDDKLKLRFGDAYTSDASVVTLSFDMLHYSFED